MGESTRTSRKQGRRWALDLLDDSHVQLKSSPPTASAKEMIAKYSDPPGYRSERMAALLTKELVSDTIKGTNGSRNDFERKKRAYKESWNTAMSPLSTIVTMGFMFWMTGNTLGIFSIGTVVTMFFMQMKKLFAVKDVFAAMEKEGISNRLWPQRIIYVLWCLIALGLVAWKLDRLGLLPTNKEDWIEEVILPSDNRCVVYAPLQ